MEGREEGRGRGRGERNSTVKIVLEARGAGTLTNSSGKESIVVV